VVAYTALTGHLAYVRIQGSRSHEPPH
jgi:hypothetical protein